MNLKNINIGKSIKNRVEELQISNERICRFLHCNDSEIEKMYDSHSIDCELLLRWSKLLEYDFFRLYVGHLILYSPMPKNTPLQASSMHTNKHLTFRKNIYTQEIKDFIISKVKSGSMTVSQITATYNIPKTTICKWIVKN
ncbi:transposase [Chryseobacterium gallinarum]|uniref:Transposase n=1 Tax=Chryseobacterium gallinarum TaxID=1324352 RepID=A0ABX6KT17_CHRGL|nr:transposase [Chryseobacterium gallinarum]QIY91632.1 transposase [Chryseobacterium gallinarum]